MMRDRLSGELAGAEVVGPGWLTVTGTTGGGWEPAPSDQHNGSPRSVVTFV